MLHRVHGGLRQHGLAAPDEIPPAAALAGGVSSDIWRVDLGSGPTGRSIVVKRAWAEVAIPLPIQAAAQLDFITDSEKPLPVTGSI